MEPGYRLAAAELEAALDDVLRLSTVTWVHLTGGEPTLWREGDLDLVDLLRLISDAGRDPSFTTNGSAFLDPARCDDFLRRYFDRAVRRLILYFSIDIYHGNFDPARERAPCLDHALAVRDGLPAERAALLELRVTSTMGRDPDSVLPEEMVRHYRDRGVRIGFAPLRCAGRARALREECFAPDPSVSAQASCLLLVGNRWLLHFPAPTLDERDRWVEVGPVGVLPDATVARYAVPGN